ncbi:MAG: TVP38/TMEM64 family protein [Candidatus Schekmanbacteria bacterium]|nr:MAG: TVP38/TMEM64 family protein [Candidatus Schekmanbacteria bacterium]
MSRNEEKGEQKMNTVQTNQKRDWIKPVALISVIIILFISAQVFGLGEKLGELRNWIEKLGKFGPIAFIMLYIIATVAAIPGSVITAAAGVLFGPLLGTICVSIGSTAGASLSFIIARYFARDSTVRWLSKNEKFGKLDELTEKHGAIIVAITRLVPIFPFNLLNYGFGLTRVKLGTYVFWSWLCMLPATILYVVGAAAFTEGLANGKIPWGLIITVISFAIILTLLIRYAKGILKEKEEIEKNEKN